jgi:hypothetical protein
MKSHIFLDDWMANWIMGPAASNPQIDQYPPHFHFIKPLCIRGFIAALILGCRLDSNLWGFFLVHLMLQYATCIKGSGFILQFYKRFEPSFIIIFCLPHMPLPEHYQGSQRLGATGLGAVAMVSQNGNWPERTSHTGL